MAETVIGWEMHNIYTVKNSMATEEITSSPCSVALLNLLPFTLMITWDRSLDPDSPPTMHLVLLPLLPSGVGGAEPSW